MQVETAQHFYQPLMQQAGRYQYQYARGAAGQHLLLNDHAGFNRFTQSHFVRQQNAGCVALSDFVGNVHLVWQQAGA